MQQILEVRRIINYIEEEYDDLLNFKGPNNVSYHDSDINCIGSLCAALYNYYNILQYQNTLLKNTNNDNGDINLNRVFTSIKRIGFDVPKLSNRKSSGRKAFAFETHACFNQNGYHVIELKRGSSQPLPKNNMTEKIDLYKYKFSKNKNNWCDMIRKFKNTNSSIIENRRHPYRYKENMKYDDRNHICISGLNLGTTEKPGYTIKFGNCMIKPKYENKTVVKIVPC